MREPITYMSPDPITIALVIIIVVAAVVIATVLIQHAIRRGPLCEWCDQPIRLQPGQPLEVPVHDYIGWYCADCTAALGLDDHERTTQP